MSSIPTSICIHHTAISHKKNPDQWRATDNYHREKGWGGGGYHYEVAANGSIHQFRQDGAVSAAQYQNNLNNGQCLSICLDGNFDIELPTPAQKKAVAEWLKEKMDKYKIPPGNVFCHRKVANYKTCPGSKMPTNIYYYFITMDVANVLPEDWAKEGWDWLTKEMKVAQPNSNPKEIASKQWVATVLHRLSQKGTNVIKVPISQTTAQK